MSRFVDVFKNEANTTLTENGGKAYKTTGSDLLDLFANVGGMRERSMRDVVELWLGARVEDKELADNLVLYSRDIRNGGLGERKIGRTLLRELALIEPKKIERNLQKIVDVGRWDDLFTFEDTPVWEKVVNFIQTQLYKDVKGMKNKEPISLLAKWLPSINTSSNESKRLANEFCKYFRISPRTYRKTLSALRAYIDVVERKMSSGKWDEINFETVPSVAMNRYISAYNRHCQERFQEYKEKLCAGKAKINASVLYPYDIAMKYFTNRYEFDEFLEIIEAQWEALPNYVSEDYDVVIMADVSGSMTVNDCKPMATSVGLATYFAQRNKGAYHNMYMTFTNNPHFITIDDNMNLKGIFDKVQNEGVGYSTNLDKGFAAIFEIAKISREVPKALVVISDMEIDKWYSSDYCASIAEKWDKKYKEIGLEMPKLILWNVESRGGRVLAKQTDKVSFVSGYGVGTFSHLTDLIEFNAYGAMVKILSKPAYCWD